MKKILILSSSPRNKEPVRVDRERSDIEEAMRLSKNRDKFQIVSRSAVRLRDLRRALLEEEPHIVHFSGHGEMDAIYLEDDQGYSLPVDGNALAHLFHIFEDKIETVVLNCCYSEPQADSISKYIRYVIGMNSSIGDKLAIEFAVGFYDGIISGMEVEKAFELGKNAIINTSAYDIPVIKTKAPSVDIAEMLYSTNLQPLVIQKVDPDKEKSLALSYYKGAPPDFSIVEKYTFERDLLHEVVGKLETSDYVLVTGAGGEGKTTFLMQLGVHFIRKGYQVYLIESEDKLDLNFLNDLQKGKGLILIDNAASIKNLYDLLSIVRLMPTIKVALAARKNEWLHYLSAQSNAKNINRILGEEFCLGELSRREIERLHSILKSTEIVPEITVEKLQSIIMRGGHNFLLSTMLQILEGKSLEFIIQDVLENISKWQGGQKALEAIGIISNIEVKSSMQSNYSPCSNKLLFSCLNLDDPNEFKVIARYLAEEAIFQKSTFLITTRNPVISNIFYEFLFRKTPALLDELESNYSILYGIAKNEFSEYYNLFSDIPGYYLSKGDTDLARELFRAVVSFGHFPVNFTRWISKEIELNNIGSYEDKYTAKWLCKRGYELYPNQNDLYLRWAELESKDNNIGSADLEGSARWILNKGCMFTNVNTIYVKWADLEIKENNIGEIEDEYSARWILRNGSLLTRYAGLFIKWAELEIKLNNFGSIEEVGSARWILKKGCEVTNDSGLFAKWAELEAFLGNVGNHDIKDSARWIYKKGSEKSNDASIFISWAKLEAGKENYGLNFEENSTRWIYLQGISKAKDSGIYASWAKFETKIGNIGGYDQQYSALWLYKNGAKASADAGIYISWARLAAHLGNIGDCDLEYSARWIYKKGSEKSIDSGVFAAWAKFEINQGNFGEYDQENTACWIYQQGSLKASDANFYYSWAKFEISRGNIGNYDQENTARWIFKKGSKREENKELIKAWAAFEEQQGNKGSVDEENSAEWILSNVKKR